MVFENNELFAELEQRFASLKSTHFAGDEVRLFWANLCAVTVWQLSRLRSVHDKGIVLQFPNAVSFIRIAMGSSCALPKLIFVPQAEWTDSFDLRPRHQRWNVCGLVRRTGFNSRELSRRINWGVDDTNRVIASIFDAIGVKGAAGETVRIRFEGLGDLCIERKLVDFNFVQINSFRCSATSDAPSMPPTSVPRSVNPIDDAAGAPMNAEPCSAPSSTQLNAAALAALKRIETVASEAPELRTKVVDEAVRPATAQAMMKPSAHDMPPLPDRFSAAKARRFHVEHELDQLQGFLMDRLRPHSKGGIPLSPSPAFSPASQRSCYSALSGTMTTERTSSSFRRPSSAALDAAMEAAASRHRERLDRVKEDNERTSRSQESRIEMSRLMDQIEASRRKAAAVEISRALSKQIDDGKKRSVTLALPERKGLAAFEHETLIGRWERPKFNKAERHALFAGALDEQVRMKKNAEENVKRLEMEEDAKLLTSIRRDIIESHAKKAETKRCSRLAQCLAWQAQIELRPPDDDRSASRRRAAR